jgi:hypothetical protein
MINSMAGKPKIPPFSMGGGIGFAGLFLLKFVKRKHLLCLLPVAIMRNQLALL